MKVLVTGAAGFIGSFTASRFLGRGDEVVGTLNILEGCRHDCVEHLLYA